MQQTKWSVIFILSKARRLNEKDALISASFLRNQMEELRGIAKEIDDEYASAM